MRNWRGDRFAALGLVLAAACGLASPRVAQAQTTYSWKNVYTGGGGGFIPGIVFNQTQAGLVYVRTDIGGVYRQDPATKKWIPLLDWVDWTRWGLTGAASVASDPVSPN